MTLHIDTTARPVVRTAGRAAAITWEQTVAPWRDLQRTRFYLAETFATGPAPDNKKAARALAVKIRGRLAKVCETETWQVRPYPIAGDDGLPVGGEDAAWGVWILYGGMKVETSESEAAAA